MLTGGHRVIGVLGRKASPSLTINSVTLDGVTATQLGSQADNAGTSVALYVVPATANTTANAVVSLSGTWLRCTVAVWNVLNLQSMSGTPGSDTASPFSIALTVADGGAVFAVGYSGGVAGDWSSWPAGITEDFDNTVETSNVVAGAHGDFATGQSVTVNPTVTTPGSEALIAVAIR